MHKCESTVVLMIAGEYFHQCSRNASVQIDGIYLCLQHAGTVAIQKLIASGAAKKLDVKKPYDPLCVMSRAERKTSEWLGIKH